MFPYAPKICTNVWFWEENDGTAAGLCQFLFIHTLFVWRTSWANSVLVLGKQTHKEKKKKTRNRRLRRGWRSPPAPFIQAGLVCRRGVFKSVLWRPPWHCHSHALLNSFFRSQAFKLPPLPSLLPRQPPLRHSGCSQKSTDLCGSGYFGRRPRLSSLSIPVLARSLARPQESLFRCCYHSSPIVFLPCVFSPFFFSFFLPSLELYFPRLGHPRQ